MIQEAKNKFKRIFETITTPIAVYEVNEPKRFKLINPKFTEWFGYSIDDMPDIDHWRMVAFRDDEYLPAPAKRMA